MKRTFPLVILITILGTGLLAGPLFGQKIKIACIGNSITYGSGMPDPSLMSYPAQLQHWLGKDYEVRNFGVGGATMLRKGDKPYWEQPEFSSAIEFKPDIVLIKLGTNDSKPQNWAHRSEFSRDYVDMINTFKRLGSGPRILLLLPVPVFTAEKWGIRESIVSKAIIPEIRLIAQKTGCEVIDLNEPLKEYAHFFPDQIHPDPLGASIMVDIIYRKLFHKTPEDGGGHFNPCSHPVPSFEYRSGAGWGEGSDWFSQHEDINKIGQERIVRLVFLGNSITQSWGGEGRNVWSPVPELWDSLYKPLDAANFGISGDRTQHILWRIQNGNFDNIKPELVVLSIGVNNFKSNTALEISEGIYAIVNQLRKKTPSSTILLLGPFPTGINENDPLRKKYHELHKLIEPLGKSDKVIYRNIGGAFIMEDGSLNYDLMRRDNVHLHPAGYYEWAQSIQPEIIKIFGIQ